MTTQNASTNQGVNTPDHYVASPYLEAAYKQYLGVALQACGYKPFTGGGARVGMADSTALNTSGSAGEGFRSSGQRPPALTGYNDDVVELSAREIGKEYLADRQDSDAVGRGDYSAAWARTTTGLLVALDTYLYSKLDASSTPFGASDVDATTVQFDVKTNDILSQFASASANLGRPFNSVLMSHSTFSHAVRNSAVLTNFQVPGIGALTREQLGQAIQNAIAGDEPVKVFVGHSSLKANATVVCFDSGDPVFQDMDSADVPWSFVLGFKENRDRLLEVAGTDSSRAAASQLDTLMPLANVRWEKTLVSPGVHSFYASLDGDIGVFSPAGVRITNVV